MTAPKLIALLASAISFATNASAQTTDEGTISIQSLNYDVINEEKHLVSVMRGDSASGEITIPATVMIDGQTYTVTKISDNGFKEASITAVTIESDIIEIGDRAFDGCSQLRSVKFNTITKVGDDAFSNCEMLTDFDFTGVRDTISFMAFMYCSSLKTMKTSTTLSCIMSNAFNGCDSLNTVHINSPYVETIEFGTFDSNKLLEDLYICDGLKSIGNQAFFGCKSLKSFTAPSTLKEIGEGSFQKCSALASLNLNFGLDSIKSSAFEDCALTGRLELPITLKKINYGAFQNNKGLTEVCIPQSVEKLGSNCFSGCDGLKKVTFEGGADMELAEYALCGASALEEIVFGEGIENIGNSAARDLTSLRTVTLPSTLKSIGESAFAGCTSLESVNCYAINPPEIVSDSFADISSSAAIYVPVPALYASLSNFFGKGVGLLYSWNLKTEAGSGKPIISIENGDDLLNALSALSDEDENNNVKNANLDISKEVTFDYKEFDYATLSACNVFAELQKLSTISNYEGTINGNVIRNIAARSTGLFGTIGSSATIDSLVFLNSLLYIDLTDTSVIKGDKNAEINILAKKNSGKVGMFGFSGDIIVDGELAKGKDITVCLVGENDEEAEINGFLQIGDIRSAGDAKRCITIKQNLGVKRPSTKTTKVAVSKAISTKSLTSDPEYSEDELLKPVREFSDDEFATGPVAYWLNFSGPGYTGDYTAKWSQGKTTPVPAKVIGGVSNALYKVDYGETDQTHITQAPAFANNGSKISIAYDEKPESVLIGGEEFKDFGEKSMTINFDFSKAINITFKKGETANISQTKTGTGIKTSGLTITVAGANAGSDLKLYSLTGKLAATAFGQSVNAPSKGIYMLNVDGKTYKVVLK